MADENLPLEPEQAPSSPVRPEQPSTSDAQPIGCAVLEPRQKDFKPPLPEDLRISWGWIHFVIFIFFAPASLLVVQGVLGVYYMPKQSLPKEQLEEYFLNKPGFLFGSNVLWFALLFLFLYMTLSVLPGRPFWSTLGWKKLKVGISGTATSPWTYFFSGSALAVLVALVSSRFQTPEKMPIEELLKNRSSGLLLMGMAVLIAPLVEETVFRGYLYPLFAKSFGIVPGVLVTGVLFGLLHGAQLAWTWSIVSMLILVGIVLTTVRARTGTVFASFLLHLGYNSVIAVTTVAATHGFTKLPSH
jgi:membrane protease YdiL (CAAX protease family)